MSASVSQSAAGANAKRPVLEVFLVALFVSLLAHAGFFGLSALRPFPKAEAPLAVPSPPADEIDLVDITKSSGDSVARGAEDRAQGGVSEPAKGEASPPADKPKSPPPPPEAEAPVSSHSDPANEKSSDPNESKMHAHHDRDIRSARSPTPPPASNSAAPSPDKPPPKGAPKKNVNAAASTDAPLGPPGETPGQGGGQKRSGERDLASSFTAQLADAASFVDAWTTLPVGDPGIIAAHIEVDGDGKVTACEANDKPPPPKAFVETLRIVCGKLKVGKVALGDGVVSSGSLRLRVSAQVSDVAVPDRPGGAVAFSHAFDKGNGRASFTLVAGRRVDFTISVLGIDRAP